MGREQEREKWEVKYVSMFVFQRCSEIKSKQGSVAVWTAHGIFGPAYISLFNFLPSFEQNIDGVTSLTFWNSDKLTNHPQNKTQDSRFHRTAHTNNFDCEMQETMVDVIFTVLFTFKTVTSLLSISLALNLLDSKRVSEFTVWLAKRITWGYLQSMKFVCEFPEARKKKCTS